MGNKFDRFLNFIGIGENEALDYDDELNEGFEPEDDALEAEAISVSNRAKKSQSNIVSLPSTAALKMIVYHPVSYEDTQNIIDNLKSRKPVVVNMEGLDLSCATRILDFMAGASYALNGTIFKVSEGIFIVAPTTYEIIGSDSYDD
ncbi:MAG: cell division protein SepF [Clostridia bacterium]